MRYAKQTTKKSCGPIAILNALKWQGHKVTLKQIDYIKKECKYDPAVGTTFEPFDLVMRKRLKAHRINTLRGIQHIWKCGGAIVLVYTTTVHANKSVTGHVAFLPSPDFIVNGIKVGHQPFTKAQLRSAIKRGFAAWAVFRLPL